MTQPRISRVVRNNESLEISLAFENEPTTLLPLRLTTLNNQERYRLLVIPTPSASGWTARAKFPAHFSREDLRVWWGDEELSGSPLLLPPQTIGTITHIDAVAIRGWGIDLTHPEQPVEFILRIDGAELMRFRANTFTEELRETLKAMAAQGKLPPGAGLPEESIPPLYGFHIPSPKLLRDGQKHYLEIVFAHNGRPLHQSGQTLLFTPGNSVALPRTPAPILRYHTPQQPPIDTQPKVAIIVLNRNGAENLDALFRSWHEHHHGISYEFVIIDHASEDQSREIIARWTEKLPIRLIALDRNDSFSASCNRGARATNAPYLFFLNNDIVWLQNALPPLVATLEQDPEVCAVGLKLIKKDHPQQHIPPIIQHLGVRFQPHGSSYFPYEIAPHNEPETPQHTPIIVPAVTGAALLCRRDEFFAVGGFSEAYFYGHEDIDFCLRLTHHTGKKIVCRNDLTALHKHGHTRLTNRGKEVHHRLVQNETTFAQTCGPWVKIAYWRSLWQQDGLMTTEPPTIGVITPPALQPQWQTWSQWVHKLIPSAEIRFLPANPRTAHLADLHLLYITLPYSYHLPVHATRPDLLTIGVLPGTSPSESLPADDHLPFDYLATFTPDVLAERTTNTAQERPIDLLSSDAPLGTWFSRTTPPLRIAVIRAPKTNRRQQRALEKWLTRFRAAGAVIRLYPPQTKNIYFIYDLCYDLNQTKLPATPEIAREEMERMLKSFGREGIWPENG